jgi:ubiquinone/menaquinone biosynthesis C-methylase UbiE
MADARTIDRRRAQFELERRLHTRLLAAGKGHRAAAAQAAYQELFSQFRDHQVFQIDDAEDRRLGRKNAAIIAPLTRPGDKVLEVGCGRGHVLKAIQEAGCQVFGIDPSVDMVELARGHGVSADVGTAEALGFTSNTFDLVFSQQVLEHIHPDDVPEHLGEAYRVLKPGGLLVVETPNRRTGPQDISRGFSRVAEGLHLKEWSFGELAAAMRAAGFTAVRGLLIPQFLARRSPLLHRLRVPVWMKQIEDLMLLGIPHREWRTTIAKGLGVDDLFLMSCKPAR